MSRRALLVIPALSQGGAERQMLELARRISRDFDVTLCTLFRDDHYSPPADSGYQRIDLDLKRVGARQAFRRLIQVMRELKPDLVQSFMDRANLWVRVAALFCRPQPRIVTSVRGPWMSPKYLIVEGLLARFVGSALVVNSRSTAEEMLGVALVPPERLRIVHNFVDFDGFRPATPEARAAARARFGLQPDQIALLLSGRLSLQKHHLGLAAALKRLRREGRLPEQAVVLLAGRARDPWYARLVGPALRRAGVESQVRMLGSVLPDDVPRLYAATDVLLLPSIWEGLPNVALEAACCGLPVVATDKANADGIVADGETGFVAPLEIIRMRAWSDALGRMLELSPAERAAMGARGRDRVMRLFQPDRVLENFRSIYRAVLEDRPLPELPAVPELQRSW
jgi:glycosyltransferase involved in cell wall biosynthesis